MNPIVGHASSLEFSNCECHALLRPYTANSIIWATYSPWYYPCILRHSPSIWWMIVVLLMRRVFRVHCCMFRPLLTIVNETQVSLLTFKSVKHFFIVLFRQLYFYKMAPRLCRCTRPLMRFQGRASFIACFAHAIILFARIFRFRPWRLADFWKSFSTG